MPASFDRVGLEAVGFLGFQTVEALRASRLADVPAAPGVYAVLRERASVPAFLATSTGGWFKGRDPSVDRSILRAKWVTGARVLYIGKAGGDDGAGETLRRRLTTLLAFGAGRPVAHWGGRYLWHLPASARLVVAWKRSTRPRADERDLIEAFRVLHGARPFANLVG